MSKFDWNSVTRKDVINAIDLFLKTSPEYPSPRSTYLIYEGKKLPAKHIRGIAYKIAHNVEISKDDYSGGMETVRFFERLGFEMHYTGTDKQIKKEALNLTKETVKPSPHTIADAETSVSNRIKISNKNVIEQKNALQLILNKLFDGDIVCEKTFPWMKTPDNIQGVYKKLYNNLSKYRGNTDFAKKNVTLRCDFVCESQKLIIEYDERQHFSEARKIALKSYSDIPVNFDRNIWIKACSDIDAKDNYPVNRDEIRAYYDSTRDIEASKHGYRLVRIMHGQIDFEKADATENLIKLIKCKSQNKSNQKNLNLKIAMYLQTEQYKNQKEFNNAIKLIKKTDADILVFPEFCWTPFFNTLENSDIMSETDLNNIYDRCVELSSEIGKAVIINSCDRYGTIYSVFANANASDDETECSIYIKHTMTNFSAFDFENYSTLSDAIFEPILYKGYKIGMTICYDCNHSLFSRMYGIQDVDIIINSTGGNVIYDKWYKYNKARAIENNCYNFVTMGGNDDNNNSTSYVYGFNANGKEMHPDLINGQSDKLNIPGGIYIYDLALDDCNEQEDSSFYQAKKSDKNQDLFVHVGDVDSLLNNAVKIDTNLYVHKHNDVNVVFCITENDNILKPEKFLPLLYSKKLKSYDNRRYVLVCKYRHLNGEFYKNKLSLILKVRAMENFCAVILESDTENNCYQTGKNRTAQILKAENGVYGLDLSRMTGPEAIWKNKGSTFKASWRANFEWLINKCSHLAKNDASYKIQ